ncbi:hypothetical protein [Pseudomonas aeruginosa]|uniref:hypothetical protein n=1 Tax=Pseudomonas aeruginosa TaxID=287 RepID=UPI002359632F|nr:hypothetical protein [Pseudomonas aeruginosa]
MTYTVSIEQYELKVKITHMEVVEGNSSSWDSDWDYYGYREMEFEVVSGLVYDEDNNVEDLGANGCAALAEKYAEFIEEELWLKVDDERDDSDFDRGEPKLSAQVKLWPTPVRRDYRGPGRSRMERTGSKAGECLPQIVGGQLNPTWVEWLMNWPMGWTSLEAITHEHFKHWQESGTAYLRGDRVQELWFDQDPSETPQGSEPFEQCSIEYRDSLSDLPQERALERRDVGSRTGCSSNLRDMQITISAKKESPERSCALRGSEMLERDWKARGVKEMVSRTATGVTARVDRIKALGNGQVPRVAATAFTYLASEWI